MSFLVAAALALGAFVVAPIAAHLLRRGRAEEQEFPPAHLVPVTYRSARKKSRLEDRWLLLVRALLVFVLAVVGAVPFVRCSRLALDRDAGASVANTSVKEMIADIIAGEDPGQPRSDQEIVGILQEKGLKIARRTVAKYREELGLLPSNLRRRYD